MLNIYVKYITYMIPKIIHQIWIGPKKCPSYWTNTFQELYIEHNPKYEYKLWNNENYLIEFENYPILKIIFDEFKYYCCKADILRLIILYEYGGMYIDADSVWVNNSFDNLIDECKETNFFVGRSPDTNEDSPFCLTNGVFGCTKHHPYIKLMIEYLESSIYDYYSKKHNKKLVTTKIMERSTICGPGLFTRTLKDKDVTIFPSHYFYPICWHGIDIHNIDYNNYKKSYMFQYGGTTNNLKSCTNINFYWINMECSVERRSHMYYLFSKKLLHNKRITAYDVSKIDGYDDIEYNGLNELNKSEYCCTFSHLKAIQTSCENNDEIAIICEDDLYIKFKDNFVNSIDSIINTAPTDWEVIKINYNTGNNCGITGEYINNLDFSARDIRNTCLLYIINKKGMIKILNEFFINNKFKLNDILEDKVEQCIYKSVNTYDYVLPKFNIKNIMIVAHPDDESIFGGHVLNSNWKVICVTNGSNEIRSAEFKNAMNMAGAFYEMWDFKDHNRYNFGGKENILLNKLKTEFGNNNYDMIVTHNPAGDYGHEQHKLLCELLTSIANKNILYYFNLTNTGVKLVKKIRRHTKNIYHINTDYMLTDENVKFKEKLVNCYTEQQEIISHPEIFVYIKYGIITKLSYNL